ncbi:MAG: hypothetical protein M3295_08725 [Chloroflexota bacterium]|nr:hypothetical protein [Chloroflexota bacterium]
MGEKVAVLVELGAKRTFASAVEWPGWSRGGHDEQQALEALAAHGDRYRSAIGAAAHELSLPSGVAALEVVERLDGNSGTDFGVPTRGGAADERPVTDAELDRLSRLLRACWDAFDRAASAAVGLDLAKGPRGGGRDLGRIVEHVLEAEEAYLVEIGGRRPSATDADVAERMAAVRDAGLSALAARARGEPPPPSRRTKPPWTPRYFVRRSAWHALDHAWEIEDRAAKRS